MREVEEIDERVDVAIDEDVDAQALLVLNRAAGVWEICSGPWCGGEDGDDADYVELASVCVCVFPCVCV